MSQELPNLTNKVVYGPVGHLQETLIRQLCPKIEARPFNYIHDTLYYDAVYWAYTFIFNRIDENVILLNHIQDIQTHSKKMHFRKIAKVTSFQTSEIIELNPEDFRNHENNPYEGNSNEEFFEYIKAFDHDDTDGLSDETIEALAKIGYETVFTEYYNSTQDGEETYLEMGKADPAYRKAGGFDAEMSELM